MDLDTAENLTNVVTDTVHVHARKVEHGHLAVHSTTGHARPLGLEPGVGVRIVTDAIAARAACVNQANYDAEMRVKKPSALRLEQQSLQVARTTWPAQSRPAAALESARKHTIQLTCTSPRTVREKRVMVKCHRGQESARIGSLSGKHCRTAGQEFRPIPERPRIAFPECLGAAQTKCDWPFLYLLCSHTTKQSDRND